MLARNLKDWTLYHSKQWKTKKKIKCFYHGNFVSPWTEAQGAERHMQTHKHIHSLTHNHWNRHTTTQTTWNKRSKGGMGHSGGHGDTQLEFESLDSWRTKCVGSYQRVRRVHANRWVSNSNGFGNWIWVLLGEVTRGSYGSYLISVSIVLTDKRLEP